MKKKYVALVLFATIFTTVNVNAQSRSAFQPVKKWIATCIYHGVKHFIRKSDGTLWSFPPGGEMERVKGIDHVKAVVGKGFSIMVLKDDGTVWVWGDLYKKSGDPGSKLMGSDVPVQVPHIHDAIDICISGDVAYAILKDGSVWVWGSIFSGRYYGVPTKLQGLGPAKSILDGIALLRDGSVWVWGTNSYGQLGNDTTSYSLVPMKINGLENVIEISTNMEKRMALKADGTVWEWGKYISNTPIKTKTISNAIDISAYQGPKFALLPDSTILAWGDARLGGTANNASELPKKISSLKHVVGIHAGNMSGMALLADGTVIGWGADMMPTGTYHQSYKPVKIAFLGKDAPKE